MYDLTVLLVQPASHPAIHTVAIGQSVSQSTLIPFPPISRSEVVRDAPEAVNAREQFERFAFRAT